MWPIGASDNDELRSLLVHELTHGLDGQYVDTTVIDDLVEGGEVSGEGVEPVAALRAVVEGRAMAVQNGWLEASGIVPEMPDTVGAVADVPLALVLDLSVRYAFGETFVDAKGRAANTWDSLMTSPPSREAFMVPGTVTDESIVAVATSAADGPVLGEGVWSAKDILVWLPGESLEPELSLILPTYATVDGWAGRRAVRWDNDNESCMRFAIAADTAQDSTGIEDAIASWAENSTSRSAAVVGDIANATGCAPDVP